jgi:hydroxypyruvate isomerase
MPRFCANISMLFTESEFAARFGAAARAGFRGVEFHFPYAFDKALLAERAREAGVEVVLFDLPPGDLGKGERGIACLPSRMSEFRDGVGQAIAYARELGCKRLNMLSGIVPGSGKGERQIAPEILRKTFITNLRHAAGELAREGITLTLEPISTRAIPGIYLRHTQQALALMDEAGASNVRLQYDVFHMQVMEGDLTRTLEANMARIAHLQMADVPDRHEPGTGEINYPHLFALVDRLGYAGWIGAEYVPTGRTEDSLAWLQPGSTNPLS